ncbi:UDP-N-acetylmuramate dehydrogenase [Rehaibacterium terrae]|jgi:UDP-N-acetylmuramate dehydrogenase|uniref:UDP-N-acetylenolpyruvoylglucosamine reductase n=1 Tax=Rehaibacterium terrae TaxID=1341696 RepID=A0A7W8DFP7_9GAMM|nr:UDP-N-acetylmuramate dehydrogenase [Rehaibacterium terrae]MBB5016591.1 UDP-N-acetylmuramate dehydrogenase [Rehaibacterium terrae]
MTDFTLLEDAPLIARNTFRVPARAALLADVRSARGLAELFAFPRLRNTPVLVLGEGSNVLFAGDWPGLVLSLAMVDLRIVEDSGDAARVRAEAGVNWNDLVGWTLAHGLCGLENLALIPGTVGAAPIQNIGAYGVEVREFIEAVEAFDRLTGRIERLDNAACAFGYRDSIFKREPERWIVTAVELRLPRQRPLRMDYAGVREELAAMGVDMPRARAAHVAEAIARIRTRKLPNPALIGNAGSFFKNPVVPADVAGRLQAEHPALPAWPAGADGSHKLSAAWLIESCGWKGHREGDAGVAEQHALVLVNHGRATGAQILALARRIAQSVYDRYGIVLEAEPRILGAAPIHPPTETPVA